MLADQFAQVPLTRHKADDRYRTIRSIGFDELDDLLAFPAYEDGIGGHRLPARESIRRGRE